MSRSFRISVSDSVTKVICAEDHVSSELEILQVLPADQMSDLLAEELVKQGFERDGDELRSEDDEITVTVNVRTGVVSVKAAESDEVVVQGDKQGHGYDDVGPSARKVEERLRQQLKAELEQDVDKQREKLQAAVTDRLSKELVGLRKDLDRAVNRATAAALKQKASQMGSIKEMTEDPESGSLTIVVEV
jgi:hypothetical protein